MIRLENINKYYQQGDSQFHVLHDINLNIDAGELVAIIGESGSGKSTLINIIGFLDDKFEGTYYYNDEPIHDYDRKDFSKLRNENVGFVFQNFKLLRDVSVAENVALPLLYAGKKRAEIKERVSEVLSKVGLAVYFFNDTATTEIYTLSLHDALPILVMKINCLKICLVGSNSVFR